ncbi:hypothetical protein GXM_04414 [Nostoc sphaeroides CCNUC1]|uniref:Uncharacterized protein n=1 Tax=Nostoc sphaeroides CCNUC1 TaxID=2653204 RepID=A0A5P8W2L4_9NOSO|nr:hypothetical protein GXM_04414 [Nostoc sphaeroides CCNUC1]
MFINKIDLRLKACELLSKPSLKYEVRTLACPASQGFSAFPL